MSGVNEERIDKKQSKNANNGNKEQRTGKD